MYYKGFSEVIFVYDVTERKSFEAIDKHVEIYNSMGNTDNVKMLCGNKIDLIDKRSISTEEGMNKADEYGMYFFETSAKEFINVDELFLSTVRQIKEKYFNDKDKIEETTNKILTNQFQSKTSKRKWYKLYEYMIFQYILIFFFHNMKKI